MNLQSIPNSLSPLPPKIPELHARIDGGGEGKCPGACYLVVLVLPAVTFAVFLVINAKKNVRKLWNGRSYILISYYALLWLATALNIAWCSLQEVAWNLISMLTVCAMLSLEISIVGFLLQDSYGVELEVLARAFVVSGVIVAVDFLFKAIYVFGFAVPLFIDSVHSTQGMKWGLWIIHKLLLTTVYGYILFVHFSKWREKLPREYVNVIVASYCLWIGLIFCSISAARPAPYNYIIMMFAINILSLFACGLAGFGVGFGIWLYNFVVVCYHSLYLPFIYITFLAGFFQEEDFLLDNAYYSEMKDAGFFDFDWE